MSATTTSVIAPRMTAERRPKVHPVDEILPLAKLAAYGFQHVLAFYAGAVLVPIIVAGALKLSQANLIHLINADLFTCGIASLLQSVGIWKIRFPLIICEREVDRYERILSTGWKRLANSPTLERSAGLVEIAKIASCRFDELVANANPIATAQLDRFTQAAA